MANDVLLHAAMKENQRLMRCYAQVAGTSGSGTTLDQLTYAGSSTGSIYSGGGTGGGPTCQCPSFLCDWNNLLKPLMTGFANGIRVRCDDGYYRCNAQCTWTVPANVSRATFAMWSPGSGTSSNCCCGGAPYGPIGSFVIYKDVMVCPSEQFSLCAGCGYCCNAYQTDPGQMGCTHICGCCFCIRTDGAMPCYTCWNQDIAGSVDEAGNSFSGSNTSQIPSTDGCGPTRCSGWNFCWDTGNDNVNVPFSYSYAGWCTCCDGDGTTRHGISNYVSVTPYGYRSMYPAICISANGISNNGDAYTWMAPTICFDGNQGCNPFCWNGNSCFGCNYRGCNGGRQYPGGGGWASSSYSGCNACGGDSGRYGMICVMWNTD